MDNFLVTVVETLKYETVYRVKAESEEAAKRDILNDIGATNAIVVSSECVEWVSTDEVKEVKKETPNETEEKQI